MGMASAVLLHPGPWGAGPWAGGPWAGGWWFLLVPVFWVFWIVVFWVVLGTVVRRRRLGGRGWYGAFPGSAEGVLRERFARGEIDEADYRARLEVLRVGPGR